MINTELTTNLEYALMLGPMGFTVLPCCWPGLTGKCACPKKHGTTPKTVKNMELVRRGELRSVRAGHRTLIPMSAINELGDGGDGKS